jgi:hypothetical protein
MKKVQLFLLVAIVSIASMTVNAQTMTTWNWKTYGVEFKAPSDFKVQTNTADEFTAKLSNDLLHLSIIPWRDATLTTATLKKSVRDLCTEMGYTSREIGTITDIELNGLEGCYAIVSKDGVTLIVEGLLDPASETNFYAIIVYGGRYEPSALNIANSFSK